jgi:hypothetical protein
MADHAIRNKLMAVSAEPSTPDGFATYIKTGIECWAMIKKIGRHVRIAENLFNGPRPRGLRFRVLGIRRPNSAKDDGVALIFSGQIKISSGQISMWPSAATGYPAISRVD